MFEFSLSYNKLFLILYSQTCLLTPFPVGTREGKTKKEDAVPWYKILWDKMKYICTCCRPEPAPEPPAVNVVDGRPTDSARSTSAEVRTADSLVSQHK